MGFFVEPLGHVITQRGQISVSRTDDDTSSSLRVYVQNVSVCAGTTPTRVYTCGRVAGTQGDFLNVHTRVFRMARSLVSLSRVEFPHTMSILHRIHCSEEHGLSSSFDAFSSWNACISYYGIQFIRVPDVVDVLGKSFR